MTAEWLRCCWRNALAEFPSSAHLYNKRNFSETPRINSAEFLKVGWLVGSGTKMRKFCHLVTFGWVSLPWYKCHAYDRLKVAGLVALQHLLQQMCRANMAHYCTPPVGPYSSPMPLGTYGVPRGVGVSYERSTPILSFEASSREATSGSNSSRRSHLRRILGGG